MQMNQQVELKGHDTTAGVFKGYHIHPSTGERVGVLVKYASKNPPIDHGFGEKGVALFSMNSVTPGSTDS